MHICATGIAVGVKVGSFRPLVTEFSQNHSPQEILHCRIDPGGDHLWRTINRLPPPYPPRMTRHANFACTMRKTLRKPRAFC
jgi:hypothetical protein